MSSRSLSLPVISGLPTVLSQVYDASQTLPREIAEQYDFESDVTVHELADGLNCLNHATRVQQLYGMASLRQVIEDVRSGHFTSLPDEVQQTLLDSGFVVPPGEDKRRYQRELMQQEDNRALSEPSFTLLRILLTDICNLSCDYCKVIPNVDLPQKLPLSKERLEEVIQFYFSYSTVERPKIIHITGGEPTIFFDRVREIIEMKDRYARPGENVWMVIGTNATLIDEERAAFLAHHDVKCIVSMDGPQEIHDLLRQNRAGRGSWADVDRGIKLLKKAGAEVSLSMVIGKHSIDSASETIEWFLSEYEPTGLGVNFMKPPTPAQRDYEYLLDEHLYADTMYGAHKRFRDRGLFMELIFRKLQPFIEQRYRYHDCGAAGGTNLNVDAKGNVGPCKSFLVMKQLAISDLSSEGYRDAVINKWRRRSPIYYSYCDQCSARGMCGNGCAYDARIHSGDEMAIDIRSCEYTKRFNRLFIEDLGEFVLQEHSSALQAGGFHLASKTDREKLLGDVRARPRTLSYSIGHQTMD